MTMTEIEYLSGLKVRLYDRIEIDIGDDMNWIGKVYEITDDGFCKVHPEGTVELMPDHERWRTNDGHFIRCRDHGVPGGKIVRVMPALRNSLRRERDRLSVLLAIGLVGLLMTGGHRAEADSYSDCRAAVPYVGNVAPGLESKFSALRDECVRDQDHINQMFRDLDTPPFVAKAPECDGPEADDAAAFLKEAPNFFSAELAVAFEDCIKRLPRNSALGKRFRTLAKENNKRTPVE